MNGLSENKQNNKIYKVATAFKLLISNTKYSYFMKNVSIEKYRFNTDTPFRFDYKPEKNLRDNIKRKKTTREQLIYIRQLLSSNLSEKLYIFFILILAIKPHIYNDLDEDSIDGIVRFLEQEAYRLVSEQPALKYLIQTKN